MMCTSRDVVCPKNYSTKINIIQQRALKARSEHGTPSQSSSTFLSSQLNTRNLFCTRVAVRAHAQCVHKHAHIVVVPPHHPSIAHGMSGGASTGRINKSKRKKQRTSAMSRSSRSSSSTNRNINALFDKFKDVNGKFTNLISHTVPFYISNSMTMMKMTKLVLKD